MVWILVLNRSILADSSQAICHYPSALNSTPLDQLTPKHFQHCCSLDLFMVALYPNLLVVSTVVGICMRIFWKVYNYRSKTFFCWVRTDRIQYRRNSWSQCFQRKIERWTSCCNQKSSPIADTTIQGIRNTSTHFQHWSTSSECHSVPDKRR